jgi:rhamnosyltransferase
LENNLSIVFPTFDSEKEIPRLLESIEKLGLDKKAEVIAVDADSRDKTLELLKKHKYVKVVKLPRTSTKGKAREEGIKASTGNIIANIDSDVEILEGWYEAIMETMKYADIVAGYSPHPKRGAMPRVSILIDGQDITYPGCNIAHKREVFEKVGYIKDTELAEDCDFNYRCIKAGHTIQYNPKMKILHHHTTTKIGFIKQAFIYGRGRWELNKNYPELKTKHQHGISVKNWIRLGFGFLGYIYEKIINR